jgi:hypothetical protein
MAGGLLSARGELESLFDELADELTRLGIAAEVVMVGSAGCFGTHNAHPPVTSTRPAASTSTSARPSIASARGHDLRPGWLYDDAAMFWPSDTNYDECTIVYQHRALVVRTPRPEIIFMMKLYRADPQDREDLVTLWPLCNFADPDDAAHAFSGAYPHALEDEHLTEYIADVAHDAHPQ